MDEANEAGAPPLTEFERQVRDLHESMHKLFQGVDDTTQAKTVVSFMGCLMASSPNWKALIPGYMLDMVNTANMVIAAHKQALGLPINEENSNGSSEEGSSEEARQEGDPEGKAQG